MNQCYTRFLYLLVVSLLPLMATAETPPAASSGIEGVIFVSPNRPGPVRKDAPAAGPAAHVTFDVRKGDQKVASFTTDAEGRFHVSLPPGHYILSRSDPGAAIGHWTFEADVAAGKATKVQWTADSGMR